MDSEPDASQDPMLRLLRPDERLEVHTQVADGALAVTDQRMVLTDGNRVVMNLAFDDLRRIQFDIERRRPATLVVVPDGASEAPAVLNVPPERFDDVGRALAIIGRQIARFETTG
ncbi:MAG TPA: hypothetical protein VH720_15830 [Candidatus Limnocylindrales bacterium]